MRGQKRRKRAYAASLIFLVAVYIYIYRLEYGGREGRHLERVPLQWLQRVLGLHVKVLILCHFLCTNRQSFQKVICPLQWPFECNKLELWQLDWLGALRARFQNQLHKQTHGKILNLDSEDLNNQNLWNIHNKVYKENNIYTTFYKDNDSLQLL